MYGELSQLAAQMGFMHYNALYATRIYLPIEVKHLPMNIRSAVTNKLCLELQVGVNVVSLARPACTIAAQPQHHGADVSGHCHLQG